MRSFSNVQILHRFFPFLLLLSTCISSFQLHRSSTNAHTESEQSGSAPPEKIDSMRMSGVKIECSPDWLLLAERGAETFASEGRGDQFVTLAVHRANFKSWWKVF